jgi:hypothetical protein
VDYGWLRVLAVPLFWVLNEIHNQVHNWGVAIIILTVIIKLLFYPLSAASYKSMAKMKVLAPKLQRLKERFGDDRQRMHQAMVEHKTEKSIHWVAVFRSSCRSLCSLRSIAAVAESRCGRPPSRYGFKTYLARTLLHSSDHNGRDDVYPDLAQSDPARPDAGQADEDHAHRVQRILLLLPIRARALLGGEQYSFHCPTVADHARTRAG